MERFDIVHFVENRDQHREVQRGGNDQCTHAGSLSIQGRRLKDQANSAWPRRAGVRTAGVSKYLVRLMSDKFEHDFHGNLIYDTQFFIIYTT